MTENKTNYSFEMINIHKSFNNGLIKANVGINLSVKENEIHAIIGENGAGKSTLMSILFGLYEQDVGDIYIRGKKVKFASSKDASKYNIGMVHQHFKLIDNYSVIDNIILGCEETKFGFLSRQQSRQKLQKMIDQYGFDVKLNEKVSKLTVGQQQKVEILKVLYRDSNILIFDEPTAVLSDNEITSFLEILKTFKKNGKTIVIISHKLNEIKTIADTATIIRKGKYIDTVNVNETSVEKMAELMVGRKVVIAMNESTITSNEEVLKINNLDLTYIPKIDFLLKVIVTKVRFFISLLKLKLNSIFKKDKFNCENEKNKLISEYDFFKRSIKKENAITVSFNVHAGEIFAIAGIEGNGQSELVSYISGLKLAKENNVLFLGNDISKKNIRKRNILGISHVPEDRHKYGLVLDQNCRKNLVNNQISDRPFSNFGFLVEYEIASYANQIINNFDVRGTTNGTAMARSLSGGNQQKLIMGREITKKHKLLVMAQPTRGLDVGAVEYIHKRVLEEKAAGNAIVLVSYELDEILSLADTIAVINRNAIIGIGSRNIMTRQKIGELLAGQRQVN